MIHNENEVSTSVEVIFFFFGLPIINRIYVKSKRIWRKLIIT